MKITLFTNATILDATEEMLSSIDKSDFSQEHIIVVPDKYSLQTEKKILSLLGDSLFNVRVLGLTKLADELLADMGVKCEVVSEGESLLLTQKAIDEVAENFKVFKRGNFAFCQEMNKLISQLKSSCIESGDLSEVGKTLSAGKYHDIKLVYEKYNEYLGGKLDANGKLLLASRFACGDALKNKHYYFGFFEAFTAEGFKLLESLISFAGSLSFASASPISIGNDYLYDNDIIEKIIKIGGKHGVSVEVKKGRQDFSPTKKAILQGVLSYDKINLSYDGFYTLLGGNNLEEEVNFVGREVFYLLHKGYRYSDIGIYVSDLEKYQSCINRVFDKFNFVYFLDLPVLADKSIIVRAIKSLFAVGGGGYQKEDLVSLFLNPLFGCQNLIDIVQKKEVGGKRGYKVYLSQLFSFDWFFEEQAKCKSTKDFVSLTERLLGELENPFEEFWKENGGDYLKEELIERQAFDLVRQSLELLEKYDSIISGDEFVLRLSGLLNIPLSTPPTFIDGLNVVDATSSSMENKKIVFILGGQDLPCLVGEGGLLSDEELKINPQKEISPTIRMINRRNRFKLFSLLSTAKERLIITYQILNDEGKKNELPSYITSLNQIFSVREEKISQFLKSGKLSKEGRLLYAGNREFLIENGEDLSQLDKIYLGVADRSIKVSRTTFSGDAKELFFGDNKFSASQLESYFSCPFKHYVRYGLNLKEREKKDFSPIDIGNICHKMAELFVKDFSKERVKSASQICEFVAQNFDRVIIGLDLATKLEESQDKRQISQFLKKYVESFLKDVQRELLHSSLTPLPPEKSLSSFSIGDLTLKGRADRVDTGNGYFKIVDYKTGKTKDVLKELYFGNKLQLFLYANAVQKESGLTCGGVFYFNAKFDYAKSEEDKKLLKGIARGDEDFIPLLDYDIELNGKSDILSIERSKTSKKGLYKGKAIGNEDFSVYLNYASKVAGRAVKEIEEGYIQPKPSEGACQRCAYRGICLKIGDKERQTGDKVSFEE